jgi:hypothetical protein
MATISLWTESVDVLEERIASTFRVEEEQKYTASRFQLPPAYSSTLKVEVIRSSETSAYFHRTTRLYSPEDRVLKALLQLVVQFTALSAPGLLGIHPYNDGRDLNWKGLGRNKL